MGMKILSNGVGCVLLMVVTGAANASFSCGAASGRTSGHDMLPLVELYTSEGCDSCPPANRWLSATFPPGGAGASVLAFHVDYWDRLGWKDRFASPDYTARQYASMQANKATFVYTPQVLVQGHDVDAAKRGASVKAAGSNAPRATIAVDLEGADLRLQASVADASARRNAAAFVAYTESGLVSDVKAGENRGVHLRHDHVVRALYGPYPVDGQGQVRATVRIELPNERGHDGAIVAFVQDRAKGDVLQTLTWRCGE
jgi:hypothetical protein